jgi:aminopeptidase N
MKTHSPSWLAPFAALALLLVAPLGAVAAETSFAFATTPGSLPKNVVPTHYAIDLVPDLQGLSLAGSEVIDIDVREATNRIVINAVNMTIASADVDGKSNATIALNAPAEIATLSFPQPLAVGPHRLNVAFKAQINKFGRGLYVVDYPTEHGKKRMISSQLEPADARRVFPCWDEPAFKATFALTVTVPQSFLAVSNMPVAREEPIDAQTKRVAFAPTPKMSSYLFVLAAGELERLTGEADGVTVGVVTTAGKREQGHLALDDAIKLLGYYNEYFGHKYPLPKLDLIAVPGGFGGAMENWGGITFFESHLLFDPATSAPDAQRGVFIVLAHEMAHQWFGDLVTMAWWDNLWLNEGFASWMQAKAAEHFHPQWQVWLNASAEKQYAMVADERRTTHAIQQTVANESEAAAAFDGITYSKGQAFIRMLESYLGEDAFRAGIRRYMAAHAYSNSTTADLWTALAATSGKPVADIAAGYTEQAGVPLVISKASCANDEQRLSLHQERFTVHDPHAAPRQWQIPIAYGPIEAPASAQSVLLARKPLTVAAGRCGEAQKVNLGNVGYYRVEYDEAARDALTHSFGKMAPADRVNFLYDSWALVVAQRLPPASYFDVVEAVGSDEVRAVWVQVTGTFGQLDFLERGKPARPAWRAYARRKLLPAFASIGWDAAAEENEDVGLLRTRFIRALGDLGDADVVAEAKRRFAAYLQDPKTLQPALRDAVMHLAGRTADRAAFDALLGLARKTTSTAERVRAYNAAASALDPDLAREALALTLTDELPSNFVGGVINAVAGAGEHPDLALSFVLANFDALSAKQGPSFRHNFVSTLMTNFSDTAHAAELKNFAPVHETSGGRIVAARSEEEILIDADFAAHVLPTVDDWVAGQAARR